MKTIFEVRETDSSWFSRNVSFVAILVFISLIHLGMLAVKMHSPTINTVSFDQIHTTPPIKIKFNSVIKNKKQIVQSDDPETNQRPKGTSYLGDKNRKFVQESIAKKIAPFKSSGKGQSAKESISLSDLGASAKGYNPYKMAVKEAESVFESGDDQKRGVTSTNDYVADVPLGDITNLNTVEFKYYGFYHRIRQELEQFWGRSIQEKASAIFRNGSTFVSEDNFLTALEVTLNEEGRIVEIVIRSTSGVKELDDSAIESFNKAGPFPHPPKGLVENGLVKISWGFVVST